MLFTHGICRSFHFVFHLDLGGEVQNFYASPAYPSWSLIKSLSELFAHKFSALRSHQIPHGGSMPIFGSTAAKGPSTNTVFVVTHYAFGGRQGCKHTWCLCPPLRLRGRTGVFHRREGYLLAAQPWALPSSASSRSAFFPKRCFVGKLFCGVSSCRGAPPADPSSLGSAIPSSPSICASSPSSIRGGNLSRSSRTCFPTAADERYGNRLSYVFAPSDLFRGLAVFRGGRTCFPGRDCVLLNCLQCPQVLTHGSHELRQSSPGCPRFRYFLNGGKCVCVVFVPSERDNG